jgi:hypothetical protein
MQRLESLQKRLKNLQQSLSLQQSLEKRIEQSLDNMINQRSKKGAKAIGCCIG